MFHRHKWKEIDIVKVPPLVSLEGEISMSQHLFKILIQGTTTYISKCEKCGKVSDI